MANVKSRIAKLEAVTGDDLPLEIRAWLGHELSDAERAELAQKPAVGPWETPSADEIKDWPQDMRDWVSQS